MLKRFARIEFILTLKSVIKYHCFSFSNIYIQLLIRVQEWLSLKVIQNWPSKKCVRTAVMERQIWWWYSVMPAICTDMLTQRDTSMCCVSYIMILLKVIQWIWYLRNYHNSLNGLSIMYNCSWPCLHNCSLNGFIHLMTGL